MAKVFIGTQRIDVFLRCSLMLSIKFV